MKAWLLMGLLAISGVFQTQSPTPPKPAPTEQEKQEEERKSWPRTPGSLEEEMRYRVLLEQRESERRKALEAAEEIILLAREFGDVSKEADAQKTLKAIEKLAKRIRSFGGGGKAELESKGLPNSMTTGAEEILKLAESLKQQLETFDHRVLSVGIISDSEAIIQLSNHLLALLSPNGARILE